MKASDTMNEQYVVRGKSTGENGNPIDLLFSPPPLSLEGKEIVFTSFSEAERFIQQNNNHKLFVHKLNNDLQCYYLVDADDKVLKVFEEKNIKLAIEKCKEYLKKYNFDIDSGFSCEEIGSGCFYL